MQNVKFNTLEEFLDFLPEDERLITEILRNMIFDCEPQIKEKLSYNVPFYHLYSRLFFIWPASVLWGAKKSYEGVRLGFTLGYLLTDEINYLDKGNRKQVYYKDFVDHAEIDTDLVKSYIFESIMISKEIKKEGIPKNNPPFD
ncbi:MAG: DUF1801 domain-containing protein [Flavobacteriales bacterium]|nr:DUF1801 domain-containing protein [Flavobacteriales bacterium]